MRANRVIAFILMLLMVISFPLYASFHGSPPSKLFTSLLEGDLPIIAVTVMVALIVVTRKAERS